MWTSNVNSKQTYLALKGGYGMLGALQLALPNLPPLIPITYSIEPFHARVSVVIALPPPSVKMSTMALPTVVLALDCLTVIP